MNFVERRRFDDANNEYSRTAALCEQLERVRFHNGMVVDIVEYRELLINLEGHKYGCGWAGLERVRFQNIQAGDLVRQKKTGIRDKKLHKAKT